MTEINAMQYSAAEWVAAAAELEELRNDAACAVMDEATMYGPGPISHADLGAVVLEAERRIAVRGGDVRGGRMRREALVVLRERFPRPGARPRGLLS